MKTHGVGSGCVELGSGATGQEQNRSENLWGVGQHHWGKVRSCGMESGSMGQGQTLVRAGRGGNVGHGRVSKPCRCCVGACGCCAPCLAVTRTICWRKRCLSQPTACTKCRSCTGVLQHPTVFMGPAQGDAAVPTAGRWLGVSSISGLELVKGNASRARTQGRTACPHKAQKGRAPHGAQTGLTAAESHPKDPSGSFQGCPIR